MGIFLPSATQGPPLPSSSLLADGEDPEKTELRPWTVSALLLDAMPAADFLCHCAGKAVLKPGVVIGKDLSFWTLAMRSAGSLAARQQFLPTVTKNDGVFRASWEAIFDGVEADRMRRLADAMPHACRSLFPAEVTAHADCPSARVALEAFVTHLMDSFARHSEKNTDVPKGARPPATRSKRAFHSLHDQWLSALRSPEGTLQGNPKELAGLIDQLAEWRRPFTLSSKAPFRLAFRLEEPPSNGEEAPKIQVLDGRWRVQYLLQGIEDPSLLVPAGEVWTAKGRKAALLQRPDFEPKAFLLSCLGHASKISSEIETSLQTAVPAGYELDDGGAHEFLTEKAWMLEQFGFGVLLPAWWSRKGTKQQLRLRASIRTPFNAGESGLTLDSVLHFDWQVALGGETLSPAELEMLAKLKAPLVKVRGQWVQLSAEEIQAAVDFWRANPKGEARAREILQLALSERGSPRENLSVEVEAKGWLGDLLGQLNGKASFEEMETPGKFRGTLRPYQVRGYSWLNFLRRWGLGACLADDMGLGKTVQTLALIQKDWDSGGKRPTLLVAPMSVTGNWQKEAARFTPDLPVLIHHGMGRMRGKSFEKEATQHALVVTSYALLHRDLDLFKDVPWAGFILDEAQNIKNPETRQAQAARSLSADYRIALTGTPIENHVGDLWSLMEFLNPGLLGNRNEFKRRFFIPIQTERDPQATERLKRVTRAFILRRVKTDRNIIQDLPEKIEMNVYCNLTREQASLYQAVVQEAEKTLDEAEGIQRKGMILATLSKLKQVCNHPAQFMGDHSSIPGRSGKLGRLAEIVEEILQVDDRALIFTQFSEMGEILRRHLQETFGEEALFLHGKLAKRQRDRMVDRFQAEGPGPRLFILSLKAGGTGLNLTRANHVFHFDRWWNPAVENQATDRAYRIGQGRKVQVHKFICIGTLEERIHEMIERKKEIAGAIVEAGEAWLTELSTSDLKKLMKLDASAVGE